MTNETNNDVVENTEAPENQNINISIEQICAAILNTLGSVDVSIENLLQNYTGKSIAINQDQETKVVTFSLADVPAAEAPSEDAAEAPAENA
jgi:hypothetical protein